MSTVSLFNYLTTLNKLVFNGAHQLKGKKLVNTLRQEIRSGRLFLMNIQPLVTKQCFYLDETNYKVKDIVFIY